MTRIAPRTQRRGMAYIAALLLLVVSAILAASFSAGTRLTLAAGNNQLNVLKAQMAAESGLAFAESHMSGISISPNAPNILEAVRDQLITAFDGSGNLSGESVTLTNSVVSVPSISLGADSGSFTIDVAQVDASKLRVTIIGRIDDYSRSLSLDFNIRSIGQIVFDNAVAANGTFILSGNASISGHTSPDEANLLSMSDETDVFILSGNASVEGDVYSQSDLPVAMSGNSSIAGFGADDPNLATHVHSASGKLVLPEPNISPFEAMAASYDRVTAETTVDGQVSFTNIVIEAGANPTFSGGVELNGLIFIEAPNQVSFSGSVTITGIIVTQDAGDDVYADNTISFHGNIISVGVDSLPDEEQFAQIKQMSGTFLLAPGFGVSFDGNFDIQSGTMAAEQLSFSGGCSGTVQGSIISYGPDSVLFQSGSDFRFDRSNAPSIPPGFIDTDLLFIVDAGSYDER